MDTEKIKKTQSKNLSERINENCSTSEELKSIQSKQKAPNVNLNEPKRSTKKRRNVVNRIFGCCRSSAEELKSTESKQKAENSNLSQPNILKKKKKNIVKRLLWWYKSSDTEENIIFRSVPTQTEITMTSMNCEHGQSITEIPSPPNLGVNKLNTIRSIPEVEKPNLTRQRSYRSELWQKVNSRLERTFGKGYEGPSDIIKAIKNDRLEEKKQMNPNPNKKETTIKESSTSLQSLQSAPESVETPLTTDENNGKLLLNPEEQRDSKILPATQKLSSNISKETGSVSENTVSLALDAIGPPSTNGESKEKEFDTEE